MRASELSRKLLPYLCVHGTSFTVKSRIFKAFIYLFIVLLAVLGPHCCTRAFSSTVHGFLIVVASLVVKPGFWGMQGSVLQLKCSREQAQ